MNSVVHFEIPADDMDRVRAFYKDVFAWETQPYPMGDGDYITAMTGECDEKGRPSEKGRINGGFVQRDGNVPTPIIVMNVPSAKEALERVKTHGGSVLTEPTQIGDFGMYAYAKDSEGNVIGVWQDLKKQ